MIEAAIYKCSKKSLLWKISEKSLENTGTGDLF